VFREQPTPSPDPTAAEQTTPAPRTVAAPRAFRLRGHQTTVHALAFLPHGRQALSAAGALSGDEPVDCVLRLWDLEARAERRAFSGHTAPVLAVAVSADGRWALSGGGAYSAEGVPVDCTVRLWDVEQGTERVRLTGHTAPVQAVAFIPRSNRGVSCAADGSVREWDLEEAQELRRLDDLAAPQRLAVAPAGQRVLIGCGDGSVRVWDLQRDEQSTVPPFPPDGPVRALGITGEGWLALAVDNRDRTGKPTLSLVGEVQRQLRGPAQAVLSAALSADGRFVAAGGLDGAVLLWEPAGKSAQRFEEAASAVSSVAVARQGRALLAGTTGGSVWYWPAVTRRPRR